MVVCVYLNLLLMLHNKSLRNNNVIGERCTACYNHNLPFVVCKCIQYDDLTELHYKMNPAPDGHRCGVCPTYFQKICAFDFQTNSTVIFDNHCVMDLYNCMQGTRYIPMKYDKCLYFGNFAYVHGYKYADEDYGEDHIVVKHSKKNPDFISRERSYGIY